jgi:hypothetical protein
MIPVDFLMPQSKVCLINKSTSSRFVDEAKPGTSHQQIDIHHRRGNRKCDAGSHVRSQQMC